MQSLQVLSKTSIYFDRVDMSENEILIVAYLDGKYTCVYIKVMKVVVVTKEKTSKHKEVSAVDPLDIGENYFGTMRKYPKSRRGFQIEGNFNIAPADCSLTVRIKAMCSGVSCAELILLLGR